MRNNARSGIMRQGYTFVIPRYVGISEGRIDAIYPHEIESDFRTYDAFALENIPNLFTGITNERLLQRFVERYGLLGYHDVPDEEAVAPYCSPDDYREPIGYEDSEEHQILKPFGEPIAWIFDQAKWVGFCMKLIEALTNDPDRLFPLLVKQSTGRLKFKEMVEDGRKVFYRDYYRGGVIIKDDPTRHTPQKPGELVESFSIMAGPNRLSPGIYRGSSQEIARKVVTDSVMANIISVKTTFMAEAENFILQYEAYSLIEAIWWHVSQAALLASTEGKLVMLCEECGTPFVAKNRRQQYCPPDEFSKRSLCGAKNRMRRMRARKV